MVSQAFSRDGEIDFETTWSVLKAALEEIHARNASKLSFEELYRHGYKLVLKRRIDDLYFKVKDFEREWLTREVLPKVRSLVTPSIVVGSIGQDDTQSNERRVAGERFLRAVRYAYEHHTLCMNMITDVLMYMVRLHVALHDLRLTFDRIEY